MELRPDLSNKNFMISPFLAKQIVPITEAAVPAGVFLAQRYQTALSGVQTGRAMGAAPDEEVMTFDDFAFSTTEYITRKLVDDRQKAFCGSEEKAIVSLASVAQVGVSQKIETAVAVGLMDSSNIATVDATTAGLSSVALAIDTAVQAVKQLAGVEKVLLVASDYIWTSKILADTTVAARLENPSTVVYNSGTNFKNAKLSVFAGEFGLDDILLGSNTCWYTNITNKNYCLVLGVGMGGAVTDGVHTGTLVVQSVASNGAVEPGFCSVGTYQDDTKHSLVLDAWARAQFVEINPEISRKIKLA